MCNSDGVRSWTFILGRGVLCFVITSNISSSRKDRCVITTPLLNSSSGFRRSAVRRLLLSFMRLPQRSWNSRWSRPAASAPWLASNRAPLMKSLDIAVTAKQPLSQTLSYWKNIPPAKIKKQQQKSHNSSRHDMLIELTPFHVYIK